MGIGHRVYKVRDPRAGALMKNVEMMVDSSGERQWFDIASRLEAVATQDPYFKDRNLSANVDFYSAPLLYSIGIPVDAFTCMFAMSRIVGWTGPCLRAAGDNRLIRPLATTRDSTSCRGCHGAAQVGQERATSAVDAIRIRERGTQPRSFFVQPEVMRMGHPA